MVLFLFVLMIAGNYSQPRSERKITVDANRAWVQYRQRAIAYGLRGKLD